MISHQHKCIFVHIPKTAGTSIEYALGHFEKRQRLNQDHRSIRMIEPLTYHAILNKENLVELKMRAWHNYRRQHVNPNNTNTVNRAQYNEYFKFTIVRNPWDRLYSLFFARSRAWGYEIDQSDLRGSFRKFVGTYHRQRILRSQMHILKNFRGDVPVDYIGRFEDLPRIFQDISNRLSIKVEFPHLLDRGPRASYRDVYDDEMRETVRELYKDDIDYLGYEF